MMKTKYDGIASAIRRQIENGTLMPGDKMPSVRHVARRDRVSITTVISAYMLLEKEELIESRPRSGFYVKSAAKFFEEPLPQTVASRSFDVSLDNVAYDICHRSFDGDDFHLGAASAAPELLPMKALTRSFAAVLKNDASLLARYDSIKGFLPLRNELAKRMSKLGVRCNSNELVTTVGTAEAISLGLRATTQPGDVVAVESPTYFILLQLLEQLNLRALEIPSDTRTGMEIDALDALVRKHPIKAVVSMANFHNPIGSLIPDIQKKKLVELLAARRIPLIEDDVWGDLSFSGIRPRPLKAYDRDGSVIYCSSFSKTLGAGLRVGWMVPGKFQEKVEKIKLAQSVASPTIPQAAVAHYLATSSYDRHIRTLVTAVKAQTQRTAQTVSLTFPESTRVSRPQGGFVLWIQMPRRFSALKLYDLARREGLGFSPGPIFSASGRFKHFIRLNCGFRPSVAGDKAIARIGRLAEMADD